MICSLLSQEPALRVNCSNRDGEEALEKARGKVGQLDHV